MVDFNFRRSEKSRQAANRASFQPLLSHDSKGSRVSAISTSTTSSISSTSSSGWRRFLRSCMSTSSNPDSDDHHTTVVSSTPPMSQMGRPNHTSSVGTAAVRRRTSYGFDAPQSSSTVKQNHTPPSPPPEDTSFDSKRQRRASYVPKHAQRSFATTTTPLAQKDLGTANRVNGMYHAALSPEVLRPRTAREKEDLRRRRRAVGP
ncbi:hypothetical protein LTS18_007385 [Coniosporium uncinatum]|uniref:Uncharacterized protein n=1 Tax=Coniosporium uncinatum TaxID=93489 RepID=A0ACC3DPM6_9PEZI|nr:hypothetical protein LTS18_007385 [Coniosporium uncinatum]